MNGSIRLALAAALGVGVGVLIGTAEITPPDGRPAAALDVRPAAPPPWALHRAGVLPAQDASEMQATRSAGRLPAVEVAADQRAD